MFNSIYIHIYHFHILIIMKWPPYMEYLLSCLPNFEYCCLNCSCNPVQSTTLCLNNSYHNLASPVRVKQNLCNICYLWEIVLHLLLNKDRVPKLYITNKNFYLHFMTILQYWSIIYTHLYTFWMYLPSYMVLMEYLWFLL